MQFEKKRNVQNVCDGLYISPQSMQHSIISYQLRKIILVGDSMRKYECKKKKGFYSTLISFYFLWTKDFKHKILSLYH